MAYYHPCKNCARKTNECARRNKISDALSGLCITSVKFKCPDRVPLFRDGQRVSFSWRAFPSEDYDEDDEGLLVQYTGVVVSEAKPKFIVRVDDAVDTACGIPAKNVFRSSNLIIKVKPSDMVALNEPDANICLDCCALLGEVARCRGWGRERDFDSYWPNTCVNKDAKLKLEDDKNLANGL